MIFGTGMWVLMPVAVALGGDFSDLGVYLLGSQTPLPVNESMLPWLWPLSLVTTIAGALLFFGRGYRIGLTAALAWVGVGAVAIAVLGQPSLLAAGSFVAFLIYSGRGSFEVPESPGLLPGPQDGRRLPDRARSDGDTRKESGT